MKNKNNVKKEKKHFIKTKTRLDGGKEVELSESPSKTLIGKIFAVAIAVLTMIVPLIGLIYLLIKVAN